MTETLTTIECSRPGERYTLFESGPLPIVHLAGPGADGRGTGRCICGFDRFAAKVGFSVGGGVSGPGVKHEVCGECRSLIGDRPVRGLHAGLFVSERAS